MKSSLFSFPRKRGVFFVLFWSVLFFLLLYWAEWYGTPEFNAPAVQTIDLCLTYLKEWNLYVGDPYCFQGPVVYLTAFILDFFLPSFEIGNYLLYFFTLFWVTYLLCKIIEKEIKIGSSRVSLKEYLLLELGLILRSLLRSSNPVRGLKNPSSSKYPAACCDWDFLFLIFISVFIFGKAFLQDFTTVLVVLFLTTGFYLLFYQKWQGRELFVGILFALAIFSKPHNAPIAVLAIILYYYGYYRMFSKKNIKSFFLLLVPIFLVFDLLLLFLPGFVFYNYIVHSYNPVVESFGSVIMGILTLRYWYDGLYILFFIGVVVSFLRAGYYKKNDIYMCISVICFFVILVLVAHKFSLYKLSDQFRYFVPFLPFYIINFFLFGQEFIAEKKKEVIWTIIILVLGTGTIIYSTLGQIPFSYYQENHGINDQKIIDRIKQEVEYPVVLIPQQNGKLFTDINYSRRYGLLNEAKRNKTNRDETNITSNSDNPFFFLSPEQIVLLDFTVENSSLDPDMAVASNFLKAGILETLKPYFHSKFVSTKEHTKELRALNYSVIIYSTYLDFQKYITAVNTSYGILDHYCSVSVPFFEEGVKTEKHHILKWKIWFLEKSDCDVFKTTVTQYYTEKFDTFCGYGNGFISLIQNGIKDSITFERECFSPGRLIYINNSIKIQTLAYCLLFFLYLFYLLGIVLWKQYTQKN